MTTVSRKRFWSRLDLDLKFGFIDFGHGTFGALVSLSEKWDNDISFTQLCVKKPVKEQISV